MRYPINPVPKPRMTRLDKWAQRDCVLRYRAYKDELRARKVSLPYAGWHVTFILPMPRSWSEKKKTEMDGKPHRQKPDVDNLLKGLMDAVFHEDCAVWDTRVSKYWGRDGAIIVEDCHG